MVMVTNLKATDVANEWLVTFFHDDGTEQEMIVTGQDAHEATIAAGNILIDMNSNKG